MANEIEIPLRNQIERTPAILINPTQAEETQRFLSLLYAANDHWYRNILTIHDVGTPSDGDFVIDGYTHRGRVVSELRRDPQLDTHATRAARVSVEFSEVCVVVLLADRRQFDYRVPTPIVGRQSFRTESAKSVFIFDCLRQTTLRNAILESGFDLLEKKVTPGAIGAFSDWWQEQGGDTRVSLWLSGFAASL